jgi:glycosyltransferase involved in cell wall biosynthesis
MLKLLINCGACESFIALCLDSVKSQTYGDWQAFVTVDPCGDRTFAAATSARDGDPRIYIEKNPTRRYAMHNLVNGIGRSGADLEDIIVVLDGDDWFATDRALDVIAGTYRMFDCWMTYGSWISNVAGPSGRYDGSWPAYPDRTTDFRRSRWLGTAIRTWKKWLWDHIDDKDLRDSSGEYFRVSEDQAVMLPLLEMSGTSRAKHIAKPLMVYNKATPHSTAKTMVEEILRNADLLARRPPYALLAVKSYVQSTPEITNGRAEYSADTC